MTNDTSFKVPGALDAAVRAEIEAWRAGDKMRRLWARDASLWTGADEASWLGWLGIAGEQLARRERAAATWPAEIRGAGFTHAVVLGMGGSSLCPEVLKMTFGRIAGHPELFVLDSTDPAQIRALERRIDLASTLFIVSSKSGTTLEPNIFMQYFFDRVQAGRAAPSARALASSPSPTRARGWSRWRRPTASGVSSPACRRSGDGTRPFPTSAWRRRRSWGSTSSGSSVAPSR